MSDKCIIRKDRILIEGAKFAYSPNFSGAPTIFDKNGGVRSFSIIVPKEAEATLVEQGFNLRKFKKNDPEDDRLALTIKVSNMRSEPDIRLIMGNIERKLDWDEIGDLDAMDLEHCDLRINASVWNRAEVPNFDWNCVSPAERKTAYLQTGDFHVYVDELDRRRLSRQTAYESE